MSDRLEYPVCAFVCPRNSYFSFSGLVCLFHFSLVSEQSGREDISETLELPLVMGLLGPTVLLIATNFLLQLRVFRLNYFQLLSVFAVIGADFLGGKRREKEKKMTNEEMF